MATWRVDEFDWSRVLVCLVVDLSAAGAHWRHPSARPHQIAFGEREEISRCLIANIHCGQLPAPCGGQPPRSAVKSGAGGGTLRYRAVHADAAAWGRAHRPKSCKLAGNAYLCREISAKLIRKWSPQQIAGWLIREHQGDDAKRVSHETIYWSLFIQIRGVLKKELLAHFWATRSIRRSRHATLKRSGLGQIKDMVSNRE